jgi:hypothetical protein
MVMTIEEPKQALQLLDEREHGSHTRMLLALYEASRDAGPLDGQHRARDGERGA